MSKLTWPESKECRCESFIDLKIVKDDHISNGKIAFKDFSLFTFWSDV